MSFLSQEGSMSPYRRDFGKFEWIHGTPSAALGDAGTGSLLGGSAVFSSIDAICAHT